MFERYILKPAIRWLGPFSVGGIVVFGPLLSYDFQIAVLSYPGWASLLSWFEFLALPVFLISCLISLFTFGARRLILSDEFELRDENRNLLGQIGSFGENIWAIFDGQLVSYSEKLKLHEDQTSRVSVYVHDSEAGAFVPCGRYSQNPELRKRGRASYPDNIGLISVAWQEKWVFRNEFPADIEEHFTSCNELGGIDKEAHSKLTMHAQLYAFLRIDDFNGQNIGLIVFESNNTGIFSEAEIKEALEEISVAFSRLIASLESYIPKPSNAGGKGF